MKILHLCDQCFWAIKIYRLTHYLYIHKLTRLAILIYFISKWITSIDIFPSAIIGANLKIIHGNGVVIGQQVKIGNKVTILQQVTVGVSHLKFIYTTNDVPTIEDDVTLGAGSKIIGGIRIGSRSIVGANAVVIKDVPPDCLAVGVPAKIINRKSQNNININLIT